MKKIKKTKGKKKKKNKKIGTCDKQTGWLTWLLLGWDGSGFGIDRHNTICWFREGMTIYLDLNRMIYILKEEYE